MQDYILIEMVLNEISTIAFFLLVFIMIERFRLASGMGIFTDKLIRYLEGVHNKQLQNVIENR